MKRADWRPRPNYAGIYQNSITWLGKVAQDELTTLVTWELLLISARRGPCPSRAAGTRRRRRSKHP
jgi:hypothetical protein